MKRLSLFVILIAMNCVGAVLGQSRDDMQRYIEQQKASFNQYKEQVQSEYSAFLEKKNAEFAAFLSRDWEQYKMKDGEAVPEKPFPKEPIVAPDNLPDVVPVSIPIKEVVEIPKVKPVAPLFIPPTFPKQQEKEAEKPITPITTPQGGFGFTFAGSKLSVGLRSDHKFSLSDVKEHSVSTVWSNLAKSDISKVVEESLRWKEALRLNDYLYVLMLDEMCSSFFGAAKHNEARLLKTYLLTQSGYDAKFARTSSELVMLLAIEEPIYEKTYITIDGTRYYIIDEPSGSNNQYYTFTQKFSEESKSCSVRIEEEFVVNTAVTSAKTLKSKRYPSLAVSASVDRTLIELYNSYPCCKWDVYAKAPMSSQLSAKILPTLRAEIAGKSEIEAADMILNFVQTAFEYKTDDEYFGYERSLFVDETFYYPCSDCEDRSILFANLVQNLLGLDVVLIHYPNHLATAVSFNTDPKGDHIMVKNKKYTICDPTYIGANIGVAMPQYKSVAVEVVVL